MLVSTAEMLENLTENLKVPTMRSGAANCARLGSSAANARHPNLYNGSGKHDCVSWQP